MIYLFFVVFYTNLISIKIYIQSQYYQQSQRRQQVINLLTFSCLHMNPFPIVKQDNLMITSSSIKSLVILNKKERNYSNFPPLLSLKKCEIRKIYAKMFDNQKISVDQLKLQFNYRYSSLSKNVFCLTSILYENTFFLNTKSLLYNIILEGMKKSHLLQKEQNKKLIIDNYRRKPLEKMPLLEKNVECLTQCQFQKHAPEPKKQQSITRKRTIKQSRMSEFKQKQKNSLKKMLNKQQKNISIFSQQKRKQRFLSLSLSKNQGLYTKRQNVILKHNNINQSIFYNEIRQIFNNLVQSYQIQIKNSLLITMKKQGFFVFLDMIFQYFNSNSILQDKHQIISQPLKEIIQKINLKSKALRRQHQAAKMIHEKQIVNVQYTSLEYLDTLQQHNQTIINYLSQKKILQQKIQLKKKQLQVFQNLCKQKQMATVEFQRKYSNILSDSKAKTQKLQAVNRQLSQKQSLIKNLKEKTENILNFVQKQEQKKILHCVSEAYKQIECQIYDYATYLQCNAMASSLTWQPKPFRAVQKWVYEEMDRVNKYIMCEAESLQDKSAKMKEFITNTTRKFRNKDQQMMKITDYKTECIKKFIKMMQRWLQNWELKQQYLVNLRNEFALKSQEMNKIFQSYEDFKMQNENSCQHDYQKSLLQSLKQLWKNVELNYKYGNSFY